MQYIVTKKNMKTYLSCQVFPSSFVFICISIIVNYDITLFTQRLVYALLWLSKYFSDNSVHLIIVLANLQLPLCAVQDNLHNDLSGVACTTWSVRFRLHFQIDFVPVYMTSLKRSKMCSVLSFEDLMGLYDRA